MILILVIDTRTQIRDYGSNYSNGHVHRCNMMLIILVIFENCNMMREQAIEDYINTASYFLLAMRDRFAVHTEKLLDRRSPLVNLRYGSFA